MTHSSEELLADRREGLSRTAAGGWEPLLVALFCLLAAARVAVFSLAFPFFSHVDEHHHFDLVCRYSHGDVPRGYEPFSAEAAALIALYASPEYTQHLGDLPAAAVAPPLWATPAALRAKQLEQRTNELLSRKNIQFSHPPLYYTLAGLWYNLGKMMGVEGGKLLYWARCFNVPLYALLVWLSYLLAKEVLPTSRFVYLGVPFLLVSFPQDVFYNFNDDVLSGPMVALALYLLLRFYRSEAPRWGLALCAGLATAAAVLTKMTNAPILVVLGAVALLKIGPAWWRKQPLVHLVPVMLLLATATLPVGCWLARNCYVLGDATGFALRCQSMTWTPKPLGQYGNHPIFTAAGFVAFWNALLTTFWRGQVMWHGDPLAAGPLDLFYVASSTVFLLVFAIATVAGGANMPRPTRLANAFFLVVFALSVAILIHSSIQVDFGHCFSPSRQWPFFSQGRMILGALVPFLIMYLSGLESLLGWLGLRFLRLPLLIILVDVMAVAEIAYSMDVFASPYNWFHLP